MDKIIISQLQAEAVIGVYEQERHRPQSLLLDVEMDLNITPAANTDDLSLTIDYANVCQTLRNYIASTQFQLLETLAEKTAEELLKVFNITSCQVTIYKQPFDLPYLKHVAVQIKRSA